MKTSKRNLAALAVALLLWLVVAVGAAQEALTAEDYYRTAVTEFGDDPYTGAEKDGAITLYTRAIKVDPTYHAAYNARGHMYALLDEYPQAIKDYSKAIELDPSQAEYWYNRGTIYGYIALYQEAARDLDQALAINPRHAAAYYERGAVRYGLGEKAAAKQDYEKAVQLNPRYNGYGNYGNILKELKHTIWKSLDRRAGNYELAGVYQSAAACYEITDRLKPVTPRLFSSQEPYLYIDRAKIYAIVGQYQRAIDIVNMGFKNDAHPDNYSKCEYYMWRGAAYTGLGNKEQALRDFEEATKASKTYPMPYLLRGKCYEKFGDYPAAIQEYLKAPKIGMGGGRISRRKRIAGQAGSTTS